MGHVCYSIQLASHFYMKIREVNSSHTIIGMLKLIAYLAFSLCCTLLPFASTGNGTVNPSVRQQLA